MKQYDRLTKIDFKPMGLFAHQHLMTIVPSLWLRKFPLLDESSHDWLCEIDENNQVLVETNLSGGIRDDRQAKTLLLLVHGLEGCSSSHYMKGVAAKALEEGFNVFRMNLRNCGGTEHLSNTLYNAGMSDDVIKVARAACSKYGFEKVILVGFSLGGNIVLKAASELAAEHNGSSSWLHAVAAISPSIDLSASVDCLESGMNKLYQYTFLRSLRAKILVKAKRYPERFSLEPLPSIKTVREFDEVYTSKDGGYDSADHYYRQASSKGRLKEIKVPVLIITAQDDPLVPIASFREPQILSETISLLAPEYGGHGGFMGPLSTEGRNGKSDRFWAEERVVDFCIENI